MATVASLEADVKGLGSSVASWGDYMTGPRATVTAPNVTLIDLREDINRVEREAREKNMEQDGSIGRLNAELDALRREVEKFVSCTCASMQDSAADEASVEGRETEEDLARRLAREQVQREVQRAAEKRAADTARYGREHEVNGPAF